MSRHTVMTLPATLVAAVAGLILVIASGARIPIAAQGAPAAPRIPQDLRNRIQRDGRARVIVELTLPSPHVPEATLRSLAAIALQRQRIGDRRARLLARLPAGSHREIRRFTTVPYVVLDVTPAALAALDQLGDQIARVLPDVMHKTSLADSVPLIEADQVWANGFDGTGTMIAVLDTGVDAAHPFLAGKVVEEACYSTAQPGLSQSFCPNGLGEQIGAGAAAPCPLPTCEHGTHVAGIAAGGSSDPTHPFPGVAKGAELMAVQVFTAVIDAPSCGGTAPCVGAFTSDIIAGLERVYTIALGGVHHVAAVNMSLGADIFEAPCDDQPYKPAIDNLRAIGVATVIAAGNDGWPFGLAAPACVSSAISVGATDKQDTVAWFSNTAPFLSLFAPGDSITSSVPGGGYEPLSGTSMAAPHVAGVWGLLKQAAPDAGVTEILNALQSTGLPITDDRYGDLFGPGVTVPRVRALRALATLVPISNPMPVVASLSPGTIRAGLGGTLTVIGSGFTASSVVEWNGVPKPTQTISATLLHASIVAADVPAEGSADVTVFNPPPDGGRSAAVMMAIGPPPTLTISAPIVARGQQETVTLARGFGGSSDTLALAAAGASDSATVRTTTVGAGVTDRTWTVTMPATAGTFEFRLYADGARTTTSAPVIVDPTYSLPPTIDSILPTSAIAGVAFTLTVSGSNFSPSSSVRWNGVDRPTTFVNGTALQAAIAASDVPAAGTAQVTLFTPPPGGGTSASRPFTILTPPSLTIGATTVTAGSPATVTLTNGLGGAGDWLAFADAAAPDTSVLQYVNVGAAVTTRTWTVTVPASGSGSYEFRLFRDGGYVRVATSPRITAVAAPPPALSVNATSVNAGSPVTVTLTNGFGGAGDWIAFANATSADTSLLQYVNVGAGVTTRTWTVTVPATGSGSYEFRLFRDGGYVRAATSPRITAVAAPSPVLTVNATSVTAGSPVTVTLTNGFGGAGDWIAFASATAADTSVLQYVNVGAGVTTRTWTVTVPATGTGSYEFRLFRDGGYVRAATSPRITAIAPPAPVLTVSATTVAAGSPVTVTLTNGFGGAGDWLAFADATAPDTSVLQSVNVGAGVTTRTWTVAVPTTGSGTYEFRLFRDGGYVRAATSPRITAVATTLTVDRTSVPAGSPVTVTLTNGFGGAGDWIAFANADAPDTSVLQYVNVGAGVTTRTWTVTVPAAGSGSYEFRLFRDGGYARAATSPRITTIAASPPVLAVNATSVVAGSPVTVTLTNGFGGAGDWIAFANATAPDTAILQYVNVGAGVTTRTWTVTVPATGSGSYEFRLFRDGGYVRAATSPTITAVAAPSPVLTVSVTSVAAGSPVTVTLTNGYGGGSDWIAFANATAPDTSIIQYVYVGGGVTTRTWTVTVPATGSGPYEFRLFRDGGYVRAATSPTVTVH